MRMEGGHRQEDGTDGGKRGERDCGAHEWLVAKASQRLAKFTQLEPMFGKWDGHSIRVHLFCPKLLIFDL